MVEFKSQNKITAEGWNKMMRETYPDIYAPKPPPQKARKRWSVVFSNPEVVFIWAITIAAVVYAFYHRFAG